MDLAAAARFTRLSKVLAGVLLLGGVATSFIPSTRAWLCLVPGRTLPCVWNVLTAGFVHTNIVEVLGAIVSLLLLARVIEPVYGSTEFLKFILVAQLAAGTATFVLAYLVFILAPQQFKGKTLYAEFCGFWGVLAALLVAVKQVMPHQEVILGGLVRLPTRAVPGVYVLASSALALLLRRPSLLAFLWFGGYAGWAYLRFFQQQPDSTLQGDPSDEFRFAAFFPEALQPPVDAAGEAAARLLRLPAGGLGGAAGAEGKSLLPTHSAIGSSSPDASRRRERGVRALQERLEMKQVAEAHIIDNAAIAAAAAASTLPDVATVTPAPPV